MSTELELLCRCLNACGNKKEIELNFTAYYNLIGKKLLPYLENTLRLKGTGLAEEIFQEIMVKIFSLCIERPQTAKCIEELTRELETFDLNNPFLKKRTHTWTNDVRHWVEEAISFPQEHSQTKSPELDNQVKNFNDKIKPLEKEGVAVLDWLADNKKNRPEEDEFIEKINELIKPKLLSKICLPTSDFLYTMARNKAKDHWKKHSTKFDIAIESDRDNEDENPQSSIIEKVNTKEYLEWVHRQNKGISDETDNIPEAMEFLLQAPIRKAEIELQKTTEKQAILRCENRLDKARINYANHLNTLEMKKKEYTQQEIAVNLGLTRDQVRTLEVQIKILLEPLNPRRLTGDLS